ncbi:2-nitropropane dioxygenase, partial [Rhodococcus sp. IITR03]
PTSGTAGGADEDALAAAYTGDDPDIGVVYAGEAAGLVRSERPAGEVIRGIAEQAETLLSRFR